MTSEAIPCLNKYFFIQMEYCSERTLKDYINNHKSTGLDPKIVYKFTHQILMTLKKIHKKNIIHRDIKPDNIFIINENTIKIGDFGLAEKMNIISNNKKGLNRCITSADKLNVSYKENEIGGTAIYLSPEQLERNTINGKVDIFATGLVLYEMISCFTTEMERNECLNDLKKYRKITGKAVLNFPLQSKLILKMTEKNKEKRPNAEEVLRCEEMKKWKKEISILS